MIAAALEVDFLGAALLAMVVLVNLAATLWSFRRRPAIEAEFATKVEMAVLEERMNAKIDKQESRFEKSLRMLGDRMDTNHLQSQRQLTEVHEKINKTHADTAYIKGKLENG